MTDNPSVKEVFCTAFNWFNAHDLDGVAPSCADDFTIEDSPAGMTLRRTPISP